MRLTTFKTKDNKHEIKDFQLEGTGGFKINGSTIIIENCTFEN